MRTSRAPSGRTLSDRTGQRTETKQKGVRARRGDPTWPRLSGAEPASRRSLIARTIGSCKFAFLAIAGVSVVINLLMLTGPLFMLQIYDRVLTSRSLLTLAALAAALYVFFGVLEGIRARAFGRVGAKVDIGLSGEAVGNLRHAPAAALPRRRLPVSPDTSAPSR